MAVAGSTIPPALGISRVLRRGGESVRRLSGWHRHALAFSAGILSALAFAPFGISPLLLLAYALLVVLIDGTKRRQRSVWRSASAGWTFGFGHFLAGLYWIGYAFTVDPSAHAWQLPFVALLLPGGFALFPACACALASAFWKEGAARIFLFAAIYGILEWLRGHILTGFPWNLAAYAWGGSIGVMQSVAAIGAYGLTLLSILLGASLARFADAGKRTWMLPAALSVLFGLMWLGGGLRVALVDPGRVPGVALRLVQPDVPQQEKYLPQFRARNWNRLIQLSATPARLAPTDIIWPEAAPPFLLARHPEALGEIAALSADRRVLMTGAVRAVVSLRDGFHFYNSFYIFADGGRLLATYDKFHLVPFGEYLPLSSLLGSIGVTKLVGMPGGFTAGSGPQTYDVPGAPPVGPLICYEVLFPGAVVGARRPGWLVNVTDDSWFGPSTGPYQHLLAARFRAIEEGLPIARAANTGISAVIDPLGRVVASLGLGEMGVVDAFLPRALPNTPYARLGDLGFFLILAACGIGALQGKGRHS